MKNKYISPSTKVVTIVVGKHFMGQSEQFNIQSGEKSFSTTLSRKDNSSWDDEDE